ncbi:phosphoethanolamine transferase [Shivajiella indica]|uniref:Phosphoethanolamine transferase n=1 Tax=Shivajiella indica TaxID=872115 RepID=A0ABW5BFI6_9BACT
MNSKRTIYCFSGFKRFAVILGFVTPIVYLNITGYSGLDNYFEILSKFLFTIAIFFFLQFFFKNEKKTFWFLMLLYIPTLIIEFFNILILNQYLSHDNIKSIYYTNWNETSGFVRDYAKYALFPLLLVAFLIFLFSINKQKEVSIKPKKASLLFSAIIFGVLSFSIPFIKNINSYIFLSDKNIFVHTLKEDFFKKPPLNFYYRLNELRSYIKRFGRHLKLRESFSFQSNTKEENQPDVVILIIGEAMRSSNWTLNGYEKLTSPYLSELDNLISFKSHYSNANQTSNSIPTLITKATPANFEQAFKEKSIISLFKEVNYQTAWISNQFIFFLENQSEPDTLIANLEKPEITDIETLVPFKNILDRKGDNKIFILINLLGNHTAPPLPYKNHFKPNTNGKKEISYNDSKEEIINDYDNKILFQDFILGELINSLKREKLSSLLIFTSDHGINLFDDDNSSIFGYGSDNPSITELHIPLFIWFSEQYKEHNEKKIEIMIKNKNKVSDNLNIFHTVADLSGIDYLDFNPKFSLARNEYEERDSIPIFNKKKIEYIKLRN